MLIPRAVIRKFIIKILKFQRNVKMAAELKTNGTTAEYSPKKTESLLNGSNGEEKEKYTKKDLDADEERVPLRGGAGVDVEKSMPLASLDEVDDQEHDTRDSVTLSNGKKQKKKKKEDQEDLEDEKKEGRGSVKGKRFLEILNSKHFN